MIGILTLTACTFALSEGAAMEPLFANDRLQVRAREVWVGGGKRLTDALLVIEDGKIVSIGKGTPTDSLPLVEHDGVLTAGIIVCQTESGARGETFDSTRSILPDALVAYGYDPDHSDFAKALAEGITSLVITPSRNVVGGRTAVVSSLGELRSKGGHLAISLSSRALSSGTAGRARDGGAEDTDSGFRGTRYPTSYPGALRELERRFTEPQGVFARAAKGDLPVVIEAWDRNEVVRALAFAKAHGLSGAIRGAPLAGELVDVFKDSGMAAILGPYAPEHQRASLASFARLAEAGVRIGFALDAPGFEPAALRLSVALAIGAGADAAQVWNALTADAASIAGVADRVGTLEVGKLADFVLWSGDPLELTSRVDAVYVGGELAYDGGEQ